MGVLLVYFADEAYTCVTFSSYEVMERWVVTRTHRRSSIFYDVPIFTRVNMPWLGGD